MSTFQEDTVTSSKVHVECTFPRLDVNLHSKDVFENIYNRQEIQHLCYQFSAKEMSMASQWLLVSCCACCSLFCLVSSGTYEAAFMTDLFQCPLQYVKSGQNNSLHISRLLKSCKRICFSGIAEVSVRIPVQGPVSQKSRKFSGLFRLPQFLFIYIFATPRF